jgi:integrase
MTHKLHKEMDQGKVVGLSLGIPEVDAYLRFLKHRCRANTWIGYGYDLQIFLNTVQKPVLEVTPADIFTFIQQQWDGPAHEGNKPRHTRSCLSAKTVKRRLSAISGLYEYLRVCGDTPLRANPVPRGLTGRGTFWGNRLKSNGAMPLIRVPRPLPRPLDSEEISSFLNSLSTHRDKAIILLMLLGGLRKSEALDLAVEDVDFGQHIVVIRDGKGGQRRVVAVSNGALEEVLRYLDKERPRSSSPKLFLVLKGRRRGQPLSVRGLDMIIEYHRELAGTPGIQCHRLRHTCVTRLRQAGMSLEALQVQAGHKSLTSTGIYLHLCPRELREEYLRVSDLLGSPRKEQAENE